MTLIPHFIKKKITTQPNATTVIPVDFYTSERDQGLPSSYSETFLWSHQKCSSKFLDILNLFSKHLLSFFILKLNLVFSQNTPSHVPVSNGGAAQRYHPSQTPVRHTHATCSFKARYSAVTPSFPPCCYDPLTSQSPSSFAGNSQTT